MDSEFGRPRNGMFIAVPTELKEYVKDIPPSHWRIQDIIINIGDCNVLVINSDFPTDYRINDFDKQKHLKNHSARTKHCFGSVQLTSNRLNGMLHRAETLRKFEKKKSKHINVS